MLKTYQLPKNLFNFAALFFIMPKLILVLLLMFSSVILKAEKDAYISSQVDDIEYDISLKHNVECPKNNADENEINLLRIINKIPVVFKLITKFRSWNNEKDFSFDILSPFKKVFYSEPAVYLLLRNLRN